MTLYQTAEVLIEIIELQAGIIREQMRILQELDIKEASNALEVMHKELRKKRLLAGFEE